MELIVSEAPKPPTLADVVLGDGTRAADAPRNLYLLRPDGTVNALCGSWALTHYWTGGPKLCLFYGTTAIEALNPRSLFCSLSAAMREQSERTRALYEEQAIAARDQLRLEQEEAEAARRRALAGDADRSTVIGPAANEPVLTDDERHALLHADTRQAEKEGEGRHG